MFSLFGQLMGFFRSPAAVMPSSPAAALLESADSCAGVDPHHAYELREAASAFLRVVR